MGWFGQGYKIVLMLAGYFIDTIYRMFNVYLHIFWNDLSGTRTVGALST